MEKAFENTKIAAKYHLSLKSFFKNEFKYHNDSYIYEFNRYCITKRKVYFEYFVFTNFKLSSNSQMTLKPTKIKGWRMIPVHRHILNDLSYSQRLTFLK